ncbi:MAG TPA: hypothetical protein VM243_10220 [Phycisphaerae bacterium]|nr:hypothetical protein [Phycisphaerae bacterium]
MKTRLVVRACRWMVCLAALPLMQVGGCGPAEFLSSAIANETASQVAIFVGTSVETVLFNFFGV